jgi:hypothetical protein
MSAAYQNESYVADAHALVWHIADDKRLGPFPSNHHKSSERPVML